MLSSLSANVFAVAIFVLVVLVIVAIGLFVFDRCFPQQAARASLGLLRAISRLRPRRIAIAGFEVAYLEGGPATSEAIVLVHGIGADKDNFTEAARTLTRRYRVIALDLPGFGDSSRDANASYAIADQVENLRAFAHALGLVRFHLGGSSMGGQIAANYAAKYPDQVISLWLLAPAGMASAQPSKVWTHYRDSGEVLLFAEDARAFPRVVRTAMAKAPPMPSCVFRVLGERGARDFALHMRIFRQMIESPPLESAARGLSTPSLIVWGQDDQALDVSGAGLLQALMPNSRVLVLQGIGHLPMMEAPGRVARAYLEFLEELAQAAPPGNARSMAAA